MATEINLKDMKVIELTRKEAADLVGLLAAQLANVPLVGNNASGAAPSVNIHCN